MGTTLTGLTPATTYDALLKTTDNQPITTSLKVITDGLGNDSALSLATTSASITGTLAVSSTLTASNLSGTNTGDETNATIKSKLGIATTSVDGYLTSTDWTTFNAKVGGTGTTNYVPKFSGASAIGNSIIYDNGTNVGIGTTSVSNFKFNVAGSAYFTGGITTNSSLYVGTSLDVNGSCLLDALGDGEYRLRTDFGYVSILGELQVSSTISSSNFNGTFNGNFDGTFSGTSSNTNTGDETQSTIKTKLGAATSSVDGYLTSANWNTFNGKENVLTFTAPLSRAVNTISIPQATTSVSGHLTSTDWNTFNNKVSTTRTISTTSPLSGGGDLSANRTLTIAQATSTTDGYLTSTDWNRFNNNVGGVTGSGSINYVPKFSGSTAIGNSQIFDNGSAVGINTTSLGFNRFKVVGPTEISGNLNITGGGSIGANDINASGILYGGVLYASNITGDDFRFNVSSSGVVIRGNFSITETNLTPSLVYTASTGALSMSGALSGVTSISMGGALSGATDITASGTLNVGSATTATKRLELTADNNSGENNTLRFVDTDTTASANQVIGKIEFFGSDASAPGGSVKAYISAHSLDASPDAYLDFATDQVTGTPIVRQRIQADGKVLIGTTTPIPQNTNLVQVNGGLDHNIIMRGSSGTAITLGLNDKGSFYEFSASGAVSVTIPTNASVAFPIGTQIWFVQSGAGVPTFSGDTGVTLKTRSITRQPLARFSEVKLTKTGTDEWYLTGDLKA
jgi:hypothetical protein